MLCHLAKMDARLPVDFPDKIDLQDIEPYSYAPLNDLCKRAFATRMPYYAIGIAKVGNSYRCYDAILYRLAKHNKLPFSQIDPSTRQKIEKVYYFAIAQARNNSDSCFAEPFPPPLYYSNEGFYKKKEVNRRIFSALNYFVLEEQKPGDLQQLNNFHILIGKYLDHLSLTKNSRECRLEKEKWTPLITLPQGL